MSYFACLGSKIFNFRRLFNNFYFWVTSQAPSSAANHNMYLILKSTSKAFYQRQHLSEILKHSKNPGEGFHQFPPVVEPRRRNYHNYARYAVLIIIIIIIIIIIVIVISIIITVIIVIIIIIIIIIVMIMMIIMIMIMTIIIIIIIMLCYCKGFNFSNFGWFLSSYPGSQEDFNSR